MSRQRQRTESIVALTTTPTKLLYVWGSDKPIHQVKFEFNIDHVSSSGRHFALVTEKGQVYSWGNGSSGQLGHGDRQNIEQPKQIEFFKDKTITKIVCNFAQSAAITDDNHLYVWGWRGDQPTYSPIYIDSFSSKIVLKVSLGGYHAIALVEENAQKVVYTWGKNDKGQLGINSFIANENPSSLPTLMNMNIFDIAAGEVSSAAITSVGDLYVWGSNADNGLGFPNVDNFLIPTKNENLNGIPIVALSFGNNFALAVSDTGELYGWGRNKEGQLGLLHHNNRDTPTLITALSNYRIIGVSCSTSHAIAWTDNGEVFSWGSNLKNKLGLKDFDGDNLSEPRQLVEFVDKIVFSISCGTTSLACLGTVTIDVWYKNRVTTMEITVGMTIGDVKETTSKLYSIDSKSVLVQDRLGRLLSPYDKARDLFLMHNCNNIVLVDKKNAIIEDLNDIQFIFTDDSDLPTVKAGTKLTLFDWLTDSKYSVNCGEYMENFLITFRSFSTPKELLNHLLLKYQNPSISSLFNFKEGKEGVSEDIVRRRVLDVLRLWIKSHSGDFFADSSESRDLLISLRHFIDHIISKIDESACLELTRLYHRLDWKKEKKELIGVVGANRFIPEPCQPVKSIFNNRSTKFSTYPPLEIARQLTLLSFQFFSQIEAKELQGMAWTKREKNEKSPNVIRMIQLSNSITNWVKETIIKDPRPRKSLSTLSDKLNLFIKKKIKRYEKFVEIGNHCLLLNNFSTLMEILAGLHAIEVVKEQKQWSNEGAEISSRHSQMVDSWSQMMIAHNKAQLREKLRTVKLPCIPFLGLYLTDIIHIEEGNSDRVLDDNINNSKSNINNSNNNNNNSINNSKDNNKDNINNSKDNNIIMNKDNNKDNSKDNNNNNNNLNKDNSKDNNKDEHGKGLINFRKCSMMANVIKSIQLFQRTPYLLHEVTPLRDYLISFLNNNANNQIKNTRSAETLLLFLNNQSEILTDRHKSEDLIGERMNMWLTWSDLLSKEKGSADDFISDEKIIKSFKQVFLSSNALENSLQSFMMVSQNEIDRDLLTKIISYSLQSIQIIPPIKMKENLTNLALEILFVTPSYAISILELARKLHLPARQRELLAHLFTPFKQLSCNEIPVLRKPSRSKTVSLHINNNNNSSNNNNNNNLLNVPNVNHNNNNVHHANSGGVGSNIMHHLISPRMRETISGSRGGGGGGGERSEVKESRERSGSSSSKESSSKESASQNVIMTESEEITTLRAKGRRSMRLSSKFINLIEQNKKMSMDLKEVKLRLRGGKVFEEKEEFQDWLVNEMSMVLADLSSLYQNRNQLLNKPNQIKQQQINQQNKIDLFTSQLSAIQNEIDHRSSAIKQLENEKIEIQSNRSRYFRNLKSEISIKSAEIQQCKSTYNLTSHFIKEVNQSKTTSNLLVEIEKIINFIQSTVETSTIILEKLNVMKNDMKSLGERYGLAVVQSIEVNYFNLQSVYQRTANSYFPSLKSSLASLSSRLKFSRDKNELQLFKNLNLLFEKLELIHSNIANSHFQ